MSKKVNVLTAFLVFVILTVVILFYASSSAVRVLGVFICFCGFCLWWFIQYREQLKQARIQRYKINANDRFWLEKNIPFYAALNKKQKKVFEDRIGLFLSEIKVTQVDVKEDVKEVGFYVASAAVITFWGLPYWNYGDLSEVLVYSENFNNSFEVSKKHTIQGQVYHGGLMNSTMSLSLSALKLGFNNDTDKKNVGVHEFAHLLDKEDGSIDGLPFMMNKEMRAEWATIAEREMDKIEQGKSDINSYASTNSAEFFAVLTEYYKERPKLLSRKHPEIYKMMNKVFNH